MGIRQARQIHICLIKLLALKKNKADWVFGPPALQIQTRYLTITNGLAVLCQNLLLLLNFVTPPGVEISPDH